MTADPQVTVLIPVYNQERYVAEAIDSVLAQTFADFELLVIDDGSTDRSLEIISTYTDPRIRVARNPGNRGGPWTRNRGLDLARGEYIAMLDSDDIAAPERLARQVAFLDAHPDVALVGSEKSTVDTAGKTVDKGMKLRPTAPDEIAAQLLFRCRIAHTSIMARSAIMRRFRYDERFVVSQDFELFARLSCVYPLANLPDVLVAFRRHDAHVSGDRDRVTACQLPVLRRQIERLGLTPTEDEVLRHFLLSRPRSWFVPDAAYIEWARDWLCRLRAANCRARCFDERVFDRVLGDIWISLCRKARLDLFSLTHKVIFNRELRDCIWPAVYRRMAHRQSRRYRHRRTESKA